MRVFAGGLWWFEIGKRRFVCGTGWLVDLGLVGGARGGLGTWLRLHDWVHSVSGTSLRSFSWNVCEGVVSVEVGAG